MENLITFLPTKNGKFRNGNYGGDVLTKSAHRIAVIQPIGSPSTSILTDAADVVYFRIGAQSYGRIKQLFLMITTTVASAAVTMASSDFWVQLMQFMSGNNDNEVQRHTSDSIREYIFNFPQEKLLQYCQMMNLTLSGDGRPDPTQLQVGSKSFLIPIPTSYLKDVIMKGVTTDIQLKLTFQNSLISGTAANITVANGNLNLVCWYQEVPDQLLKEVYQRYQTGVEYPFLQVARWTTTQTFSPSTTYKFLLDSINGKSLMAWFYLRANPATASGYYQYQKIGDQVSQGSINLLNQDQTLIYNNNIDAGLIDHLQEFSQHYKGQQNIYGAGNGKYIFFFGDPSAWRKGRFSGFQQFNNDKYLQFTTATTVSEVNRVITFLPELVTATAGTGGFYQINYVIPQFPGGSRTFVSSVLAAAATTATIQSAINAMFIPDLTIVVSGGSTGLGSTSGIILTISGISVDKDYHTAYRNAQWWVNSGDLNDGTHVINVNCTNTTASTPSSGFPTAASYQLDFYSLNYWSTTILGGKPQQAITL